MESELAPDGILAQLIDETAPEILLEWRRLLATEGLPEQQRLAHEEPTLVGSQFEQIAGLILDSLRAPDAALRQMARADLLRLYGCFGRAWAQEQSAEPARVVGIPRFIQAALHVLAARSDPRLAPDDVVDALMALNTLCMDLAMARVYGYMSYKEEVLETQQRTVSRLLDEMGRVETRERWSLALELHDSLAQRLVSLFSGIQHAERLVERNSSTTREELLRLERIAKETIGDLRSLIRDLHFGFGEQDAGFTALAKHLQDLEADTGVKHCLKIRGRLDGLPVSHERLVVRIIQEAVNNALRHAGASEVAISLERTSSELAVHVCDNGHGFEVEEALTRSRRRGRFGLLGMQERAQLLGASLKISSSPGQGASVFLLMPTQDIP